MFSLGSNRINFDKVIRNSFQQLFLGTTRTFSFVLLIFKRKIKNNKQAQRREPIYKARKITVII